MSNQSQTIEKFIGVPDQLQDPLGLLGLRAGRATEGEVVTALQARLTQIAAHPDGLTAEADEVRLVLHNAAARLLGDRAPQQKAPPREPEVVAEPEPDPLDAAILLTLASYGGWNSRSKERIVLLARSHGVTPEQVVERAESLVGRPPARVAALSMTSAPGAAQRSTPARSTTFSRPAESFATSRPFAVQERADDFDERQDPGNKLVRNIVIFGAIALFGSATLVVLSVTFFGDPPAKDPVAQTPQPSIPTQATELFPTKPREEKPKAAAVPTKPPARVGDWDDLLRAASASVALLDSSPDKALAEFEKVNEQMSRKWGETSGDGLVAAVDRLVEFIYRAAAHEGLTSRAIDTLVAGVEPLKAGAPVPADKVLTSAWASGVLARVGRERDLPAAVRNRVLEALAAAFPGASGPGESTFQSGCTAALVSMAGRLATQDGASDQEVQQAQGAWKEWLKGLAAVVGRDSPRYTRQVVLALEGVLIAGPEPTKSRAAFQAITTLTVALPWRKDDETRRWLLRWFDSDQIGPGDLYAVTAALAGQSGAEGVDASMVVSAGAGTSHRAEMRDRYAAMWDLTTGETREALLQRWAETASARSLSTQPIPSTPVLQVAELLELARLNQAALRLWSGDVEGVEVTLPGAPTSSVASGPQAIIVQQSRPKSESLNANVNIEWIREYLGAGQNIPQRRELIAQVTSVPDAIMSEILVEEACRGSPHQVRQDARAKVVLYNSSAPVLNALLEMAPLMPITRENAALVEEATSTPLPNLRDPTWRVEVRRALVETLLQVLAGNSDLAYIDRASELLAELYTVAATPNETTPAGAPAEGEAVPATETLAPPPTPPTPELDVAVNQHRLWWQREAELVVPSAREPFNLSQMERRRRARAELANGKVQEFEAAQLAICELMAYVSVAEQPSRAGAASVILNELEEQRRRSKSVFEQALLAERARLRLWILRMSEKQS